MLHRNELYLIHMENDPSKPKKKDVYLLGGGDLEMYQIKKHLSRRGEEFIDRDLKWGAKLDDYADVLDEILADEKVPVAVELAGAETNENVVDIDHHNDKSGRPASISQVMERIDKPMSLIDQLVAANDSSYIPGMQRLLSEHRKSLIARYGEERTEKLEQKLIDLIRAKDRQMQGVTMEDEAEVAEGILNASKTASGTLVVKIHGEKVSPVTDRLFTTWPDGKENLVIIAKAEQPEKQVYFFGRGDICQKLKEHFTSIRSWGGGGGYGKEDGAGFSGCITNDPQEVIDFVTNNFLGK